MTGVVSSSERTSPDASIARIGLIQLLSKDFSSAELAISSDPGGELIVLLWVSRGLAKSRLGVTSVLAQIKVVHEWYSCVWIGK